MSRRRFLAIALAMPSILSGFPVFARQQGRMRSVRSRGRRRKVAIYQILGDKLELFAQCIVDVARANAVQTRTLLRRDRPVRDVLVDFA